MEPRTLSVKHVAELLGVTPKALLAAGKKESYTPTEIVELRAKLNKQPAPLAPRKQLFLNFKGGTGKTSLSTSYVYRLAMMGHRVLLVDLDSQGHATKCLGFEGEDFQKTLLDVLVRRTPISDVIQKSPLPNLDFIPSNLSMSTVDLSLMPLAAREFKLRNALKEIEGRYEIIVFDAPPSFGLLNLNALMAADDLFVPVLADFLSFHGLKLLFETVQSLEEDLGQVLDHVFIIINAYNATFKLGKEAVEALRTHYPEYLLPTIVRQCTKFAQASSEGVPVFLADPDCKGAHDVQAVINEVLKRIKAGQARTSPKPQPVPPQPVAAQPAPALSPVVAAVSAPPAPVAGFVAPQELAGEESAMHESVDAAPGYSAGDEASDVGTGTVAYADSLDGLDSGASATAESDYATLMGHPPVIYASAGQDSGHHVAEPVALHVSGVKAAG
jgi:chromosome partitioning protein